MTTTAILKFKTEQAALTAEAQICSNCGIPNDNGTLRWSEISAHPDGYWYIIAPSENGWNTYSKAQLLEGVSGEETAIEVPDPETEPS